ncbi:MAG: D-alanyl-D-alanine carboxypeptidase [Rickettsiales bacterium]|nr:D-alanyl-D-alanine carboxypeptidase [Rickettsiales bacterium]
MRFLKQYIFYVVILLHLVVCSLHVHARNRATLILSGSGKILHEKNAQKRLYPASLTKLMTAYVVFEQLKYNKVPFNKKLTVSKKASRVEPTKLYLKKGEKISVRDAVIGMLVKSFNDSAIVLAEGLGNGSERKFVKIMNKRAKQLGMHDTHFENASGLHHPKQVTTAYDMAKLAMALMRDFPEYYHLLSLKSFPFKRSFYRNRNYVKKNLVGIEGMKTGYTSKAGWNMVTTAKRKGVRLIGIVLGGSSYFSRDRTMMRLMNKYFAKIHRLGRPYGDSYS